jgi:hypothetical protein
MLALLAASTGCSRRADTRLTRIAATVSDHPERALQSLDSINPDDLSESDRHFHDFLTIKARDKAFITHESDSLILDVIDYYSAYQSDPIYPEALYYGGRVYSDLGDYPTALQYFQQALDNPKQAPDTTDLKSRLNSQMGVLLQKLRLYDKAIPYFSQMLSQKIEEQDSSGIVYAQQGLGIVYYNLGTMSQVDSIRNHYLEYADSILTRSLGYAAMLPDIFSADSKVFLAGVKQAKGDIASALTLIRNTPALVDPLQRNVALAYAADIYHNAGVMDTAFTYAHELILNEDALNKKTGYRIMLSSEFRKHLHPDTLDQYYTDYKDILESYFDDNANEQALLQESQYNYKLHEREKLKEHAANERLRWIIAGIVILALIASSIMLFIRNRDKAIIIQLRDNLDSLQKLKSQLPPPADPPAMNPLSDADSTKPDTINKEPALREKLRDELMALYEQSKSQKVSPIILHSKIYFQITGLISEGKHIDDETFDELKRTVLQASPKFIDNLKILTQNKLTELDLQTALLIKCGFRPSEMTVLFARSNGAIIYRRNTLATKVFGHTESVDVVNGIIRLL